MTGIPIDPQTGFPVTGNPGGGGSNGPLPGNPMGNPNLNPPGSGPGPGVVGPPNNNNPGSLPPQGDGPVTSNGSALSQRDIIILAVFGTLFLLILLLILWAWCWSEKREKSSQDKDNETANIGADPTTRNQDANGGLTNWFALFATKSDESKSKENLKENKTANIGANKSSEGFSHWFPSSPSEKSSVLLGDLEAQNIGDLVAQKSDYSPNNNPKSGVLGILPLFLTTSKKKSDDSQEETSKSSIFKLFDKKNGIDDEENLSFANNNGKKGGFLIPFFSKKKDIDQDSKSNEDFPSELLYEDFASQSPLNSNLVLDSQGKEVYVLPPMVRHAKIDGKMVTDPVSPVDIIKGTKAANFTDSKVENDKSLNSIKTDNQIQTSNNIDSDILDKQTKETDLLDTHDPNGQEIASAVANNTEILHKLDTNMEDIAGAVVITEQTTIMHNKSIDSEPLSRPEEEEFEDDLDKWAPPAPTSHVVIRKYIPSERDELDVAIGDLIGIEKVYDDGWAKAQNITQNRKRGILPLAIITPLKSGPTQTVIKSAGGIWKTGAVTLENEMRSETITYRETSLKYQRENIETKSIKDGTLDPVKKVSFDTDKDIIINELDAHNDPKGSDQT